MKVRILSTGEIAQAFPAALGGKFAIRTNDGRVMGWREVEVVSEHAPVAEGVSTCVNAFSVPVPCALKGEVSIVYKEARQDGKPGRS
jgi:hypothetical protein